MQEYVDKSLIEMTDWCTLVAIGELKNFIMKNFIIYTLHPIIA